MAKEVREPERPEGERETDLEGDSERAILCRRCDREITVARAAIAVDGKHTHDFVNPSGLAFVVRLFRDAPGSVAVGEASTFFSWFSGHAWRIALCGGCGVHLGWRFESASGGFHGFVADRIT